MTSSYTCRFFIASKRIGLSLDIWISRKARKPEIIYIYIYIYIYQLYMPLYGNVFYEIYWKRHFFI